MVNKFKLDDSKRVETRESINRSLETARNYSGDLTVDVIPLERIELDPENHRHMTLTLKDAVNGIDSNDKEFAQKKEDWKSLESLAKTIKESQLINPIYVYRFGTKCRLISGERRTLASAIAGKKEIIARISNERPVGVQLKALQWIENSERSDLTLSEKLESLESVLEENKKEKTPSDPVALLMNIASISKSLAYDYINLIKSDTNLKEAIKRGDITSMGVATIICSCVDKGKRSILLQEAAKKKPLSDIIKLNKILKNEGKIRNLPKRKENKYKISVNKLTPKVSSIIVDSIVKNEKIGLKLKEEIKKINKKYDWSNIESAEKGFKCLVKLLNKEC